ncbi:MAG: glycosyltransferase family 9 protein [Deltaproteobacteria bacterium]|nr:glycosyltransferase family 9 protein [Deltaproteobacteria bacterium]
MIRLGALGDLVLTTGPLLHWHRTRGLVFDVVTRASLAPILQGHPAVGRIQGLEEQALNGAAWIKTARDLARFQAGSTLVDLHGNLRTTILRAFWKGPVRSSLKLGLERRLYLQTGNTSIGRRLLSLTVPQRYALALDETTPPIWRLHPAVFLSHEEQEAADRLLNPWAQGRPIVALHPYATHPAKAWPRQSWLALAALLQARGLAVLAIGRSPDPLVTGEAVLNLTDQTGIRETCALLSRCRVLVTGDSGPMHLAWAVNTPLVALFGPTTRHWGFAPCGPLATVLEFDLPCRPCSLHGQDRCRFGHACLTEISAEKVARAVRRYV